MSWDVLLVKSKFNLEDENPNLMALGNRDEIIDSLSKLIPSLDYSDKSWGILEDENFSIEFNTGNEEIVDSIMLHIRGGGNPLIVIKLICDEMNWVALDCSAGEFMDTENLSQNSWKAFQNYRDKVIGKNKNQ